MVKLQNIGKTYNNKNVIISNLNLEIEEGQFVVFVGPSGCGKTTTLKMINRLIEPTSGSIFIQGKDITKVNPVFLRRNIGYVIQQIGLFPNMTIGQNVEVVPKLLGWSAEKRLQRTKDLLEMVDMDPSEYINRYPSELSGGQQQRVGVLRALAAEPPLILMDEPFGALDPITRETLQDEIKKLQQKLNKTVIFVTHDMDEALKLADLIVIMKDGEIVQAAHPEKILSEPADDFVSEFIGKHRLNFSFDIETVADVMRPHPVTVTKDKGIAQSLALMKSKGVNNLIVVDREGILEGIVRIEEIKKCGHNGNIINDLLCRDVPTVKTTSNAKETFDLLINNKLDSIVAVDDHNKVCGLVTKTSIVKALAEVVWKGDSDE